MVVLMYSSSRKYPNPVPGPGEVLVRVAATSVNPIDYKRRAGLTKDFSHQVSGAYRSRYCWHCSQDWAGSRRLFCRRPVFAMADNTYTELCVVKARESGESSKGLDLIQAARCRW